LAISSWLSSQSNAVSKVKSEFVFLLRGSNDAKLPK
jgi:hypothetical protein